MTKTPIAALAFLMASISLARGAEVLATVNGVEITTDDARVATRLLGEMEGDDPQENKSHLTEALIELQIVSEAAEAEKMGDASDLQAEMKFLRRRALRALYIRQFLEKAVTEASVRQVYDEKVGTASPVEEVRVRHILVATELEARQVIDGLKHGSAYFDTEAKKRSLDQASGKAGGDLGFAPVERLPPEFADAIAQLKPGGTTQTPIRTAFGFHVLKLEDKRIVPVPTFEQAAPQIRSSLETAAVGQLVEGLKSRAKIEIPTSLEKPTANGERSNP